MFNFIKNIFKKDIIVSKELTPVQKLEQKITEIIQNSNSEDWNVSYSKLREAFYITSNNHALNIRCWFYNNDNVCDNIKFYCCYNDIKLSIDFKILKKFCDELLSQYQHKIDNEEEMKINRYIAELG